MTIITKIRQRIADFLRERRIAELRRAMRRTGTGYFWFKREAEELKAEYRRLLDQYRAEDRARSFEQTQRLVLAEARRYRRGGDDAGAEHFERLHAQRAAEHAEQQRHVLRAGALFGSDPAEYRWLDGTPSRAPLTPAANTTTH